MIVRLAYKNIRKNSSDDKVYFITLIIGVALFYVFHAISGQMLIQEFLVGRDSMLTEYIQYALPAAKYIVTAVLAGLVVYANRFLMKRRKKEFGLYLLFGMKKRKIAGILLVETAIVGMVSLAAGIALGIFLSQGLGVLVADMFEADMSGFTFVVCGAPAVKTLLCFLVMYAMVFVMDMFVVGRFRLIQLLNASRGAEKNIAGNAWVCISVFALSVVLLGHAYYMVTAGIGELSAPKPIFVQIGKIVAATFLIFWSLSGMVMALAQLRKRFYLRGIHAFTVKEMSSRVNTNVVAGSMICILMFIGITMFTLCFLVSHTINRNLKALAPVDVFFQISCGEERGLPFDSQIRTVGGLFRDRGVDTAMFRDAIEITVYEYYQWDEGSQISYSDNTMLPGGEEVIKLSDYNKLSGLYGGRQYTLADNEYMVISNQKDFVQWFNREFLSQNHIITFGGKDYVPKYKECQDGFLRMAYTPSNFGFTVVPDSVSADPDLHPETSCYIANYNANNDEEARRIDRYVKSDGFYQKACPGKNSSEWDLWGYYKSDIYRDSIGVTTVTSFLGLYVGILFFIVGATLFALKEMSQAVDSCGKYRTLRELGVDRGMLRRSLFCQNAVFFGGPVLLAILHCAFGIRGLSRLVSSMIVMELDQKDMVQSLGITVSVLLGIYAAYFAITYQGCRKIVEEGKEGLR